MIVRKIDSNGDWTFGKGLSNYAKDNLAIAQTIETRLRSFLGDCFFDSESGIDWFNFLGSKNIAGLILKIKSTIINTNGVVSLESVNTQLDNDRRLTVSYRVNTVYSTQTTGVVVIG